MSEPREAPRCSAHGGNPLTRTNARPCICQRHPRETTELGVVGPRATSPHSQLVPHGTPRANEHSRAQSEYPVTNIVSLTTIIHTAVADHRAIDCVWQRPRLHPLPAGIPEQYSIGPRTRWKSLMLQDVLLSSKKNAVRTRVQGRMCAGYHGWWVHTARRVRRCVSSLPSLHGYLRSLLLDHHQWSCSFAPFARLLTFTSAGSTCPIRDQVRISHPTSSSLDTRSSPAERRRTDSLNCCSAFFVEEAWLPCSCWRVAYTPTDTPEWFLAISTTVFLMSAFTALTMLGSFAPIAYSTQTPGAARVSSTYSPSLRPHSGLPGLRLNPANRRWFNPSPQALKIRPARWTGSRLASCICMFGRSQYHS